MDTVEKAERFGKFLTDKYFDYQRKRGVNTSQADFAKYLRVHTSALSHWMRGNRAPGVGYAHRLAAKLGNEVYDLLDIPILPSDNEHERRIHKALIGLTDEQQDHIASIAEKEAKELKAKKIKAT
jgi:transcriptional regulator with XRE-family HTH domain